MKHEVLYHRDAPWTVGETKAEREARFRADTCAPTAECYRDTHPGRVISIRPVESDLPSLRNMSDKDRPVVVLDIDDDERQGAASKTMKVEGKSLVPVTFDDRFGAVAAKLREQHADPEQWESDEATRVKTEEAENEKLRADHDRALEEYKALVETFPIDLHEWSMEDEGIPPAMPERPKAATFIDVAPSSFDREVSALSRSLAPTVTETGTGLYSVKVTPTKLDRTQSGAPAGQVITFTAGGLGVAAAFAGGYITNVTRSQTRAIVSHIDDAATLEGDVTTWADTDDLDIFDAWSTIQAAFDQSLTDQGAAFFTAEQIIRVFAGTFVEDVTSSTSLRPTLRYALIYEGAASTGSISQAAVDTCFTYDIPAVDNTAVVIRNMTFTGNGLRALRIRLFGARNARLLNVTVSGTWSSHSVLIDAGRFTAKTLVITSSGAGVFSIVGASSTLEDCSLNAGVTYGNAFSARLWGCSISGTVDANNSSGDTFFDMRNCTAYTTSGANVLLSRQVKLYLRNNIFQGGTYAFHMNANLFGAASTIDSDRNTFHDVAQIAGINGVDYTTLANWQAFTDGDGNSPDANSTEADPLLTDPGAGDFSLPAASPAKWAGAGAGVKTGINDVDFDPYHPDIGAWSSGVCPTPVAPSVSATDLGNQSDLQVDIIADNAADVSTIFYQSVASGLVQVWPNTITGSGSETITGLQTERYAFWATAERCFLTSESSTIDFETVAAANEVTNIRTALREWVQGVVGNPAVDWRESNAPQSIRPYVTIKMGPILTVGSDHHGGNDDTGVETVAGDREFVFFIQVHGKQSDKDEGEVVSMLNRIRSSLEKRSVQATLGAASLAFVAVEGSSDLSGRGGTRWEARAFIDIRFNTTYSDTDDVGLISEVETPAGTLE